MKYINIYITLVLLIVVISIIGCIVKIISDNNKSINYWKDIDTTQVVGQVQDSCRCTIINDKMYRVKIKIVQQEFYQPYK